MILEVALLGRLAIYFMLQGLFKNWGWFRETLSRKYYILNKFKVSLMEIFCKFFVLALTNTLKPSHCHVPDHCTHDSRSWPFRLDKYRWKNLKCSRILHPCIILKVKGKTFLLNRITSKCKMVKSNRDIILSKMTIGNSDIKFDIAKENMEHINTYLLSQTY